MIKMILISVCFTFLIALSLVHFFIALRKKDNFGAVIHIGAMIAILGIIWYFLG